MSDIAGRWCVRLMAASRLVTRRLIPLLMLILLVAPSMAQAPAAGPAPAAQAQVGQGAQPDGQPPQFMNQEMYNQSFRILFALFVLALLIESGLAVLFNWRPFLDIFDSRGVKTLVAVAFCYFIVETFDFDATTKLINVYAGSNQPVNLPGKIITALILAGGSSGVNNILLALGFRSVKPALESQARPPETEAAERTEAIFNHG